jgi:hypothetical protein
MLLLEAERRQTTNRRTIFLDSPLRFDDRDEPQQMAVDFARLPELRNGRRAE